MNANIYRLVFNARLGMFVPVGEGVRARGKGSSGGRGSGVLLAALLALPGLTVPALAQLPVACNGGACGVNVNPTAFVGSGSATYTVTGTQGVVNQTSSKAILNWQSFNVGKGYSMEFKQPSADAAALNRIWQADASAISGVLKSNGQIYLINQNGILFKDGAQVNVGGLIASTLDLDDDVFLHPSGFYSLTDSAGNVSPAFQWGGTAEGFSSSLIRVEPDAKLEAALGGAIMLFAPKVENQGEIHTQEGQTVLAAGGKVYLAPPPNVANLAEDSPYRGLAGWLVEVDPFTGTDSQGAATTLSGQVINDAMGRIIAERSNITLVGLAVNQMGRVTATSTVTQKGSIRLMAREGLAYDDTSFPGVKVIAGSTTGQVLMGADSVTEVLPELDSTLTITDGQAFNPPTVEVVGNNIILDRGASILAYGGHVTLSARAQGNVSDPDLLSSGDSRIYLAEDSLIDVSGLTDVDIEMERNFIEVELRGTELSDSELNKNGYIRGKKVWVDIRDLPDTELADVSGWVDQIGRGIGEKLSAGGTVSLVSDGDLITRQGSAIDVSGGSLQYLDGFGYVSQLVSGGVGYQIGQAPTDLVYDAIVDLYTYTDPKWGVTQTYYLPQFWQFREGYVQGQNAGGVTLQARAYALDGDILAQTIAGTYQRQAPATAGAMPDYGQMAALGWLNIGYADNAGVSGGDLWAPSVLITADAGSLEEGFAADSELSDTARAQLRLSSSMLEASGLGSVAVYSNRGILVAEDGALELPAFGALTLVGESVTVEAPIVVPGGAINLTAKTTLGNLDASLVDVDVAAGVSLSVAGLWRNDALPGADVSLSVVLDGGSISLEAENGLHLGAGSLLDADAGAWLNSAGKLKGGQGGALSLSADEEGIVLEGSLRAYGVTQGGSLDLAAPALTLGDADRGVTGELRLDPAFFAGNGFASYTLSARDSLVVSGDLAPTQALLVPDAGIAIQTGGQAMAGLFHAELPEMGQRQAVDISLSATSSSAFHVVEGTPAGWLTVEEGASITVEAGGVIDLSATQHQLLVDGTLSATAGEIRLTMEGDPTRNGDVGYDPAQAIWLGAHARLLAAGTVILDPASGNLRQGQVLDGGTVTLTANKGYLVAQAGSVIDVSGAAAELDVAVSASQGYTYQRQTVASQGGSVAITAREGMLLDGEFQAGSPGGLGGSLSLTLDRLGKESPISTPVYPGMTLGLVSNDPDRQWKIVVAEDFAELAAGLSAGDSVDAAAPGRAYLSAQAVEAAGFASLDLNAEHAVAFQGDVTLALARTLVLNAPAIESDGGQVALSAAYAGLGNSTTYTNRQTAPAAVAGLGSLTVDAQHIDFIGNLGLGGFTKAEFTSAGDIRLMGNIPVGGDPYPVGRLNASGELVFTARQVYPASLSEFTVNVAADGAQPGNLAIQGKGADTAVLSALGTLRMEADVIDQGGVVKAPFGRIELVAADRLTLEAGSLTSVSGEGQTIPLGATVLTGLYWTYGVGGVNRVLEAPDKTVALSGADVTVADGAVVDVSGGGDLMAVEWIKGLGGTKDVLSAAVSPDTYAILPGYAGAFAPQDAQYADGASQPLLGQSVYLSGVAGLADGYYTLMPARYAVLPGAYAVTLEGGYTDMTSSQISVASNGASLVPGQSALVTADGSLAAVGRRNAWRVESAELIGRQSEYLTTLASDYFQDTGLALPGDAGRVSIAAGQTLDFSGSLDAGHETGFKGAQVDISAARLAVVSSEGSQTAADLGGQGYLILEADMLNDLGAESLLLGGVRSRNSQGVWIDVGAGEVLLANDADHALEGPEILLAASERVTLAAGSRLTASSETALAGEHYLIGHAPAAVLDINQDGLINDDDALALDQDLNNDQSLDIQDLAIHALGKVYAYGNDGASLPGEADLVAAYALGDLNGDGAVDLGDLGVNLAGDGAFLAASVASGLDLERHNVAGLQGVLAAAATARIDAPTVLLDAALQAATLPDGSPVANALTLPDLQGVKELTLGAGRISLGASPAGTPGLVLDDADLARMLAGAETLTLRSYSTLDIHGDLDLADYLDGAAAPDLRISAAGIAGYGGDAVLRAGRLTLDNITGVAFSTPVPAEGGAPVLGAGTLTLDADELTLGEGDIRLAGYAEALLQTRRDLQASGNGSLLAEEDLVLASPRLAAATGTVYRFEAAGNIETRAVAASGATDLAAAGVAADLNFVATAITLGGVIEAPAGSLDFQASSGDLVLDGGQILAGGVQVAIFDETVDLPAGTVSLTALAGNVLLNSGRIDVSAVGGGDAGTLEVTAENGLFQAGATLAGTAGSGAGARFVLDARGLAEGDFSTLNTALGNGFRGERNLRLREGDILVAADDVVVADKLVLSADAGAIEVQGTLDASGDQGGEIALYAHDGVDLLAGARLLAQGQADTESSAGSTGAGGTVILSSVADEVNVLAGSRIDVSGDAVGDVAGAGGRIWLRAARTGTTNGTDLAIGELAGDLVGAAEILAEGVRVYTGYVKIDKGTSSGTKLGFDTLNTDNTSFLTNASAIKTRLGMTDNAAFRVTPGVEVVSTGNLEVTSDWNLWATTGTSAFSAVRTNNPMVLTLRAAGDLNIKGHISDGLFVKYSTTTGYNFTDSGSNFLKAGTSSSYQLAAGADISSANPLAVVDEGGSLTLSTGKFIRTGTGEIRIASGGDLILAGEGSTLYTAGTLGPVLDGFQSPSATSSTFKANYPVGGGDLWIDVQGDLSAVQTLNVGANPWLWRYSTELDALNPQVSWWVKHDTFKQGVATLGGGDLRVRVGGDVTNLALFTVSNGRVGGDHAVAATVDDLLVQGGGNLDLNVGGDVSGSLLFVSEGQARARAGGALDVSLEAMGASDFVLTAGTGLTVNGMLDPMTQTQNVISSQSSLLFYSYSDASRLSALSVRDSVTLSGTDGSLFAASLRAAAPLGDVAVASALSLFPSAAGQLELLAGESVTLGGNLIMADLDPDSVRNPLAPSIENGSMEDLNSFKGFQYHAVESIHAGDAEPVRLYALAGDVLGTSDNAGLVTAKPATLQAGRDVRDLSIVIQNLDASDVSRISAGRDIALPDGYNVATGDVSNSNMAIEVAGPGTLLLTAGRDIDLGSAQGVLSVGNEYNPYLDSQGADLMLFAGLGTDADGQLRVPAWQAFADAYLGAGSQAMADLITELEYRASKDTAVKVLADHPELDAESSGDQARIDAYLEGDYADQVAARAAALLAEFQAAPLEARVSRVFFNELQEAGKDFSAAASPSAEDAKRGYDAVAVLFPSKDGVGQAIAYSGDVNLYFSQIESSRGGDVDIFVPGGEVNVGLASSGDLSKSEADLGLFTVRGGDIRAYVRDDFLVNQSRVFTLGGGDILLWSDLGDIDAGKGAKTAAAAPAPQLRFENGRFFYDIAGSVSGSGIGIINTSDANPRDDGYLIAPNGEINAGDAGIRSSGNLTVAAVVVVGADNIQVAGVSSGVPVTDTGGLSGLAGVSSTASLGAGDEATGGLGSSAQDAAQAAQEVSQALASFKPSFITVEVLGFGEDG